MSAPENPPAFPMAVPGDCVQQPEWGMSLRDWFAGQAVKGFLSGLLADGASFNQDDMTIFVKLAFATADAMLAERAKATGQ